MNAKFILLRDIHSVQDAPGSKSEGVLLPAGCLVREIKGGGDPNSDQLLLESLDLFPAGPDASGLSVFANASLDDLLEISTFSSDLLLAEKHFKMRLIVGRDENWLEEATHMFEDTDVLVCVGNALFLGTIRFAGEMDNRVGRWFGVEVKPTAYANVTEIIRGGDGSPEFQCEPGLGLYVTISALRLADPVLELSFKGRPPGKKRFSARTTKSTAIEKLKESVAARKKDGMGQKGAFSEAAEQERLFENSVDWNGSLPEIRPRQPFEVDERVVWFKADGKAARGTVRFVGRTSSKDKEDLMAVEFDEKVGDDGYTGMTNGYGQFIIKNGYGKLLNLNEAMKEVDFGYDTAETSSSDKAPSSTSKASGENPGENKPAPDAEISLGKRVVWFKNAEDVVRGKVAFRGKVKGIANAEKIGLRLDERKGPDGFVGVYQKQDLFHCGAGYGVLTDLDQVMTEAQYDFTLGITTDSTEPVANKVKNKDRIVWVDPKDETKTAQHGTVLFVGDVKGMTGIQLGVEFDGPCGVPGWTGKASKKQYFTCKDGHGRLISRDECDTWWPTDVYKTGQSKVQTQSEPVADLKSKDVPPVKRAHSEDTTSAKKAPADQTTGESNFTTINKVGNFTVGDRAQLQFKNQQKSGTIRWMGVIPVFTKDTLVGLEMDELVGNPENITFGGYAGSESRGYVMVFLCRPGYGKFAPVSDLVEQNPEEEDGSWTTVGSPKKSAQPESRRLAEPLFISRQEVGASFSSPAANGFHVPPLEAPPYRPIEFQNHAAPFNPYPKAVRNPQPYRMPILPQHQQQAPSMELRLNQKAVTYFGPLQVTGTVKYIGVPHFSPEIHVGLLLPQYMAGAPGGNFDGVDYFDCMMGFGVMVSLHMVHPIPTNPPAQLNSPPVPGMGSFPFPLDSMMQQLGHLPRKPFVPAVRPIAPPVAADPPEHVLRALEEADRNEREIAARKDHVAVFALEVEDERCLEVKVDEEGTKGFVKFLLKPDPDNLPYYIQRVTRPDGSVTGEDSLVPKKARKDIEFFPPLFLYFHLTEGFPEHMPPTYQVKCNWITDEQMDKLREHLVAVWRKTLEFPERNILFESIRHLKDTLLRVMGLEFGILYTSKAVLDFDVDNVETLAGKCIYDTDKEVQEVFSRVAKYSGKQCMDRDEKEKVDCTICASSVSPSQIAPFFSPFCTHKDMVCKECITGHVKAQVESGNSEKIKCMGEKCDIVATLHDLADLVNPEDFDEISERLNTRKLDVMEDVRRCPACQHAVIFEYTMIGDERYITCPACEIKYCPNCKGKEHGDQPCLTSDQKRQLRNDFINAPSQAAKDELIKKYGQLNIDNAIKDTESEEYIKTHGKPCPQCKSPTEKIEGCNKMTCTICHTFFCYICGAQLPTLDPYRHFGVNCAKFDGR